MHQKTLNPASNFTFGSTDWRSLISSLCFTMGISVDLLLRAFMFLN